MRLNGGSASVHKKESCVYRAEEIFHEKSSPGTQEIMKRLWKRFASFAERVHIQRYVLEEENMLAAFALHLHNQESVKGQTVVQYLCHLVNEYSLLGVELDLDQIEALKTAMMRRATSVIKANPMSYEQVIQFLRQPQLTAI